MKILNAMPDTQVFEGVEHIEAYIHAGSECTKSSEALCEIGVILNVYGSVYAIRVPISYPLLDNGVLRQGGILAALQYILQWFVPFRSHGIRLTIYFTGDYLKHFSTQYEKWLKEGEDRPNHQIIKVLSPLWREAKASGCVNLEPVLASDFMRAAQALATRHDDKAFRLLDPMQHYEANLGGGWRKDDTDEHRQRAMSKDP